MTRVEPRVSWAMDVTILTNPLAFVGHLVVWTCAGLLVARLVGLVS